MNVSKRIHKGIKTRLTYVVPYLDKWPSAMFLGLDPANISSTVLQIHKISDEIWYQAGDKSLDVRAKEATCSTLGIQRGHCFLDSTFQQSYS